MSFAIKKEIPGNVEDVCRQVTEVIKPAGFGVLTRIDFDKKILEKTGQTIPPCSILGACNPGLALEAYGASTDVALFLPCNIVVRDMGGGRVRVEALKPSAMLGVLPQVPKTPALENAEAALRKAIESL